MKYFLTMGKISLKKRIKNEKVIIGPSESMSKSKRNTIDPEIIIKNFERLSQTVYNVR